MWRIYLRIFFLIAIVTVSLTQVLSFITNHFFSGQIETIARKEASAQIFLLEHYLDHAQGDLWHSRFAILQQKSSHNYSLQSLDKTLATISPSNKAALLRGEIIVDLPSEAYYRRVDIHNKVFNGSASQVIYVTDRAKNDPIVVRITQFQYFFIFILLLLPCGVWSFLHWRELQALSETANNFGSGLLGTRAKVRKSASVYPLAQCMNLMAERIERLIDSQRELLHSVSHELRTPIARLEFGLALLKNDARSEQLEPRFLSMENDLHELNELVTELLSLARIEQQKSLPINAVDLSNTLNFVLNSLEHVLQGKEISCVIASGSHMVAGEEKLLSRALSNLLRNAAKYADKKIRVSLLQNEAGEVEITIEDDGPGIPQIEREHIFEPFYRLDRSRDRASGGFGLGLAITKKAIALHRGSIRADQSELGGARFTIKLAALT